MIGPISDYDAWKLSNGPYEGPDEPDEGFDDPDDWYEDWDYGDCVEENPWPRKPGEN